MVTQSTATSHPFFLGNFSRHLVIDAISNVRTEILGTLVDRLVPIYGEGLQWSHLVSGRWSALDGSSKWLAADYRQMR